jgi:spermidine synthase
VRLAKRFLPIASSSNPENEIDIFAGHWASDLSDIVPGVVSGSTKHFSVDQRSILAMKTLAGGRSERKLRVLELGPLEGGHTYQFEKMGVAEIIAVESNAEAFLKCLIVKNLFGLQKARFLLGDFVEFLKQNTNRYDLIFCCGVLYHMQDPT